MRERDLPCDDERLVYCSPRLTYRASGALKDSNLPVSGLKHLVGFCHKLCLYVVRSVWVVEVDDLVGGSHGAIRGVTAWIE